MYPSLESRIPTEFTTRTLRNNGNKARLIELILKYIKEQKDKCLNLLNSDTVVFSTEDKCFLLTFAGISNITELETSHKKLDTKIILHAIYIREAHDVNVTIFVPSGDTDIIVLLLAFLQDHKERILIIDRHAEDKKKLKLSDIDFLIHPLIGFHAITDNGNDYVSSSFRKGKINVLGY